MSDQLITGLVTIVLGIIGVATIATLVSSKAQTSQVIAAGSGALANNILAAVSPVSGATGTINTGGSGLSMPSLTTSL